MDSEDWRVEVELADEQHGGRLGDLLRLHDLDDEARERLGGRVIVSKDGPSLFLYASTEAQVREAERVVRELLREEGRGASVAVTRWHPDAEEWKDASLPLPETEAERAAERARHDAAEEAEAQREGAFDWEVAVDMPGRREAIELERELAADGYRVERRWRFLAVDVLTEERGNELAADVAERYPEATVWVQSSGEDLPRSASFILMGGWNPF